jgi:predicted DNA-binding transcriptional regulator AlpA
MRTTAQAPTHALPVDGFIRQAELIGKPGRPGLIPFSAATLWRKVADKSFPAPVKLGERMTAWRRADVHAWMRAREAAAPAYREAA